MKFCHLHVHNEFSLLDGLGRASDYVERAEELGFEYLALTNHGNIDGLIKLQKACDGTSVKPIFGAELYLVSNARLKKKGEARTHVTVLVKDEVGWFNLCRLINYANIEGFYYRPRIDPDILVDHSDGLVIMTACMQSFVKGKYGKKLFMELADTIGTDLYAEVMPHDIPGQEGINRKVVKLAKKAGVKVVATNDCHYVKDGDDQAQELLLAIQRNAKWSDENRWKFGFDGLYLRSPAEMKKAFREQGSLKKEVYLKAMANTIEVAEKCCDFTIEKQEIKLPKIPKLRKQSPDEFLENLCLEAVKNKEYWDKDYADRMYEELSIIKGKKFSMYFLIVWELIIWCKKKNIMTGPGRGSVGGSLVAYLLGITKVDPIKYDLLFSRFITEDRIDYPDIDMDFEDRSRGEIRHHLEDLYGEGHVVGISTYLKMKSKTVIRDVGRVFEIDYSEVNEFAKSIGDDEKIQDAIDNPKGNTNDFVENYSDEVKLGQELEGQIRGAGQHAAAVVVAKERLDISGRCTLVRRNDNIVVNWDMADSEYMGLMKLDVLGLSTLTVLSEAKRLIKENHDKDIDYEGLPLDDNKVLREISDCNNLGVFQLGTYATDNLIYEMGVESFSDLVACQALVRPGPYDSGMTAEYIARKKGASWVPLNKIYENITKETYGLVIYQEQVMAVISEVGGLPYSTADKIRKVIGKKRDRKEFAPFKKKFVKGCLNQKTFSKKEALVFWAALEEHARYSFNKSHSTEYAMLSYWTAYIKYHYPTEFICATLTYGAGDKKEIVNEAYRMGLGVIPPKAGISHAERWVAKGNMLYVPFMEAKGIGLKTAYTITNYAEKKKRRGGYFEMSDEQYRMGGKMGELLDKIGCYEDGEPDTCSAYFDFDIMVDRRSNYPKLAAVMGQRLKDKDIDGLLDGSDLKRHMWDRDKPPILKKKVKMKKKEIRRCDDCDLSEECKRPVPFSKGLYNVAIVGEAPGRDEDKEGKGFVGRAGDLLWKWLGKRGMSRKMFHVDNVVKCYPSETKTPKDKHINECKHYLIDALKQMKCRLVLAFGNTSVYALTGRKGGITKLSGTVEWNEEIGAWICWCVHPAAVLRSRKQNIKYWKRGIKKFIKLLKTLDGFDEIFY